MWSLPGGNLEFGETFEQCAKRELLEETGLRIANVHFIWACNSIFDAATHYVTVFMLGSLETVCCGPSLLPPFHLQHEQVFARMLHMRLLSQACV